ncbi:tlde1 domain-containing protein [Hyphomicrobium sp. CS1GBMeth3]|uniref:tlde1 domain-containing protein n=1 Tax=Hyphomicrobium sp. CS1GBMeth3 TaxID=1892845 RepID=UPI001FCCF29B|nr:tlde1 domain-containing protein [Hyphomicrobium sp. CS1GBMeth3]
MAEDPAGAASAAAAEIAEIFSKVGDQIYEECIFELSEEQVLIQAALIQSYVERGATSAVARRLAATQIQPPKLSEKCEQVRRAPDGGEPPVGSDWATSTQPSPPKPAIAALPKEKAPAQPPPAIALKGKKGLAQWDCASGVDYVTVKLNGYERKLTGGEICSPFQDVVREVPASVASFQLGYTIKTGRLFVISDDPKANGQTVAWGLSGRDICRNNPDPDCFAARAIGPLPPGKYAFAAPPHRVSWGPKTKRHVAAVYLKELWNKERFNAAQTAAILKRGNIAIHVRLKGEMSEACIGLEPKGWNYVASLIKDGRATSLNVYIDEPHPQVAEAPPVVVASSFSFTSLFK